MELDPAWWTNGFWPALMILMYDATGREQYLKTAHNAMNMLDAAFSEYDALNHDMGFMWDISAGYDYRLTGNKKERNRFLLAASLLMSRFNNNGRFIRAWNGSEHKGWAIIDCMMNLPLLYRASEELDDDRFKMVAVAHADTTMKYHVRDDGSCNHINEYDCVTSIHHGHADRHGAYTASYYRIYLQRTRLISARRSALRIILFQMLHFRSGCRFQISERRKSR